MIQLPSYNLPNSLPYNLPIRKLLLIIINIYHNIIILYSYNLPKFYIICESVFFKFVFHDNFCLSK